MQRVGLLAFALVTVGIPTSAIAQWEVQSEAPETKDRLSHESMEELVAGPIATLRSSGLDAAAKSFDQLVAAAVKKHGKGSVQEADLLMSFAVVLYEASTERDDDKLKRASLSYLGRTISASRAAFGPRHPEVAVALHSYADVALALGDETLKPKAVEALEEALSIRAEKLGSDNIETVATQSQLEALRNPQADVADAALEAVADALTVTDDAEPSLSAISLKENALWKPSTYYNPVIDDFIDDMKNIAAEQSAGKKAIAAKYGLSVAAMEEGITLLRDLEKSALSNRQKGVLRARSLAWLDHSNRAPIALTYVSGALDYLQEGGCKLDDLNLLMQGTRDRDADLWAIICCVHWPSQQCETGAALPGFGMDKGRLDGRARRHRHAAGTRISRFGRFGTKTTCSFGDSAFEVDQTNRTWPP
jgi:hypothetical protein